MTNTGQCTTAEMKPGNSFRPTDLADRAGDLLALVFVTPQNSNLVLGSFGMILRSLKTEQPLNISNHDFNPQEQKAVSPRRAG